MVPWTRLQKKIAKFYPKDEISQPSYPLPVMLRLHCLQSFYNFSDPGTEYALYKIRLSEQLLDEATTLNFRRFSEVHKLGRALFEEIKRYLKAQNLSLRKGTIEDAKIISAPRSTKNESGEHDSEIHQTRKGQQWLFGMELHLEVDAALGLIHSMATTPANASDINHTHRLLHGDEDRV